MKKIQILGTVRMSKMRLADADEKDIRWAEDNLAAAEKVFRMSQDAVDSAKEKVKAAEQELSVALRKRDLFSTSWQTAKKRLKEVKGN